MIRKIIHIDRDKCTGCGACAEACHEGAIAMVDGKAELMREDFCDGFGDCLPACPADAIHIEEREAPAYDESAVKAARTAEKPHVCPGSAAKALRREEAVTASAPAAKSRLSQWPVQIKLAPVTAPFYRGANLLIAADCTAYAYAAFHEDFIRNRITLVGCPKLDGVDYSKKLGEIIAGNDIKSVLIVRMEVPCCGGLEFAAKKALQESGKFLPWRVVTVSTDGNILDE